MPNWIKNIISSKSLHKLDVFSKNQEGTYLDFDKIIPSPKKPEDCPKEFFMSTPEEAQRRHISIIPDRPWFDWYGWNTRFWGTKWNSTYGGNINAPKEGEEFEFDTAWNCPYPVIHKLSTMLPEDEELVLESIDMEDTNALTKTIWKNGKNIKSTCQQYDFETGEYNEEKEVDPIDDEYFEAIDKVTELIIK